jgi:arylesterase/paraoxonase
MGNHPILLTFAAYAKGDKEYSPSEIITIEYQNKNDYSV